MRRPLIATVGVLAVVVAAAVGCAGDTEPRRAIAGSPTELRTQVDPRAQLWSPRAPRARTPPTTTVRLPRPIDIPDDSYAPEPVVQLGSIEIPKIGVSHQTYDGVTLHNIDKGPSHWPGTAIPGQLGNSVFAGHRSTHDQPFARIAELVPGDEVIFTVNGTRTTYRVSSHLVVSPSDTWIADQTPARTATLYACHPPGSVDQRYVVRMELAA